MPRLFISRMLETFFRRKWLYLLPLVPFVALGVLTVSNVKSVYRSSGSLIVSKTLVGSPDNPFGGETPAIATSRQISTLLLTETFLNSVIDAAGLEPDIKSGAITVDEVRSAISATPGGDELVSISAATQSPQLSLALASATIDRFRASLKESVELQDNPNAPNPTAVDNQKRAIDARYRAYDAPREGTLEPHRQKDILTLVLFTTLGVLVSIAALVVGTLMDHSVRYGEEIEVHLHIPVLGAVPDSRAAIKPLVL